MTAGQSAPRERGRYQWLAILALPLLIAMGLVVSNNPKTTNINDPFLRFYADFELLQYAFAALLAAFGGAYGWAVVLISAFFKLFSFSGDAAGLHIDMLGSLGPAAALVSVASIFKDRSRLAALWAQTSVSPLYALVLIVLCSLSVSMSLGLGLGLSTWPYVYLLLAAFYIGLSKQRLMPVVVIICVLGAISVYARGFIGDPGSPLSKFWFENSPARLLGMKTYEENFRYYDAFKVSLSLLNPMAAGVIIYAALLGRGLRQCWLAEKPSTGLERLASRLTTVASLLIIASIAIVIWTFSFGADYGWQVTLPENDIMFRYAVSIIDRGIILLLPLIGFCLGAIHRDRGVLFAIGAYVAFVVLVQLAVGLASTGPLYGKKIIADMIELRYRFQGIDLGRGLALPIYAWLGMAVAERLGFAEATGVTVPGPQLATAN